MLSIRTIEPDTLELLRCLSAQPELQQTRLVGGTALALQYGHQMQDMPRMFISTPWEDMKSTIIQAVKDYQQ